MELLLHTAAPFDSGAAPRSALVSLGSIYFSSSGVATLCALSHKRWLVILCGKESFFNYSVIESMG